MKNALFILLLTPSLIFAEVKLAPPFKDHAVLQRDKPVPVWGTAKPEEEVVVAYRGQTLKTRADTDGRWQVDLAAMKAAKDAADLSVTGENAVTIHDVVVGEVWFCSGQSNMAFSVGKTDNAEAEVKEANFPLIRCFSAPRKVSEVPLEETGGEWSVTTPETVRDFSAVAFYFGRDLYRKLDVPIGLIKSSWGGTFIESWLSPKSLAATSLGPVVAQRWKEALEQYPELSKQYELASAQWKAREATATAAGKTFTKREPMAPPGPGHQYTPSGLYGGMVHPFRHYAIRGVLWYQGESNVSRANEYAELMKALVTGWREEFGQGDVPFLWVQLPKFGSTEAIDWAQLREAQAKTLALPATAQAVTVDFDLADPKNKHPTNKQPVSQRLAKIALAKFYGGKEASDGPQFSSMKKEGGAIEITFSHADGLTAKDQAPEGFEVAGSDKVFHPAEARIDGDKVTLKCAEVADPVAVRYAYRNFPAATLFNATGWPAEPFRTDDW